VFPRKHVPRWPERPRRNGQRLAESTGGSVESKNLHSWRDPMAAKKSARKGGAKKSAKKGAKKSAKKSTRKSAKKSRR